MSRVVARAFVAFFSLACFALATCCFASCPAYAQDSAEAREEFGAAELSRLFVEVDSYDECEFVMRDYDEGKTSYLRVRDEYRARYDALVGADSVRPLSASDEPEGNDRDDMPLEPVTWPGVGPWSPWRDVLHLSTWLPGKSGPGSAFLVSDRVALTAAHCVMENGTFAYRLLAESSPGNSFYDHDPIHASKAIVQREWAEEDELGVYDHDFAVLVFDGPVEGSSGEGEFSYDGMTAAGSLALRINCAGFIDGYGGVEGPRLWRNANDGSVASWENLPVRGNDYKVTLSAVKGMSGGPVYCVRGGRYVAVGVVSHFDQGAGWTYACRVTERLQVLVAWAEESGWLSIDPDSAPPGAASAEEPYNTIGIFAPSALWEAEMGDL